MNATLSRSFLFSSGAKAVARRSVRPRNTSTVTTTSSFLPRPSLSVASQLSSDGTNRCFSVDSPARNDGSVEIVELSSPKLQGLYDRVVKLPEEDVNVLGAMVLQILGRTIFPGEFGTPGGNVGGDMNASGDITGTVDAVEEEKTAFDVKLLGFNAKSKIKVIKEVRAIAGLGLKEAKELVESAPKVVQKDLKKEAADELKEKLEALGAEIEIV
eukprot:CAMPEP_0197173866 /NCGR_PEP_ID=MMETSP1423-20130617/630_1 /TAXON_ID=476441 /ORGANISM="Pseudo-nitzschia heimii, Strain UNC1101" /LENGTH=213 /DNA_ID=CAMNT_0042622735 /DNA_START=33 /DNA_END=674 /DNA_ORIENTATION=+